MVYAGATAANAELESVTSPDEVREFPRRPLELIKVGGATRGRAIFAPGWRWATSVRSAELPGSCVRGPDGKARHSGTAPANRNARPADIGRGSTPTIPCFR